ncbi:hypothetical protein HW132_27440 [Brasilonema sp. CT11]|nr:hypothetical protein [Brasilonema sp. CT11]
MLDSTRSSLVEVTRARASGASTSPFGASVNWRLGGNSKVKAVIINSSRLKSWLCQTHALLTGLTSAFSSSLEISFRKSGAIPRSGCQGHRTLI